MCCSCRFRQKFFFLHHDVHNACIYTKKARAKTRTRKKRQLLWPTFRFCRLVPFNAFLWVDLCFFSSLTLPFVVFLGNCVMCCSSSLALTLPFFVFPFISESKASSSSTEMFMSVQNNHVKWPNFCLHVLTCVSYFQELSACQSSATLFYHSPQITKYFSSFRCDKRIHHAEKKIMMSMSRCQSLPFPL